HRGGRTVPAGPDSVQTPARRVVRSRHLGSDREDRPNRAGQVRPLFDSQSGDRQLQRRGSAVDVNASGERQPRALGRGNQVSGRPPESDPARFDQSFRSKSHWRYFVGGGDKVKRAAAKRVWGVKNNTIRLVASE